MSKILKNLTGALFAVFTSTHANADTQEYVDCTTALAPVDISNTAAYYNSIIDRANAASSISEGIPDKPNSNLLDAIGFSVGSEASRRILKRGKINVAVEKNSRCN